MPDDVSTSVSSDAGSPGASSSDSGSQSTAAPALGGPQQGAGTQPIPSYASFADHQVWETGIPTVGPEAQGQPAQEYAEEGAPAPDTAVPDDDSDLDPNQPGVQAIRQAREHGRQLASELRDAHNALNQFAQVNEVLQTFGGPETVKVGMGLLQQAVQGDSKGYWNNLYGASPAIARNLVGEAIDLWPSDIARALVERGYIPDFTQAPPQQSQIEPVDPQEYELIPQEYHQLWPQIPMEQRFDLLAVNEQTRMQHLQQMQEAQEYRQLQQEVEQDRAREHQEAIERQAFELGTQFTTNTTQAVFQQLQSSFRATGDPKYDSTINVLLTGFLRDAIQQDPSMQQAIQQANYYAQQGDKLSLMNLSNLFQTRASQILNSVLPILQKPFTAIRNVQSQSAAQNQQLRVPPPKGAGNQQQNGSTPQSRRGQWDKNDLLAAWDSPLPGRQ